MGGTRVLVTGAGGFIGSHLAERLVDEGAAVRALVHYNALGSRGWLDRSPRSEAMEIVAGDVRDPESVRQAVDGVEVVFHLAALIAIPYSYRAPRSYLETNAGGTLNVLEAARRSGAGLVVHTSTSEVYGSARYVPIDEDHPLQAQSPYAASKIAADQLVRAYHRSFDLPVVTVRPFNAFGPRQSPRAVIPAIATQLLAGGRLKLGNLHPTRDLNFVANTVDGFLAAARSPAAIGEEINLGSGREISIGDLVRLIARLLEVEAEIELEAERVRPPKSEVDRLLASSERAERLLGWRPRIGLEEGLERTIAWLRRHADAARAGTYVL
ncbi:MAG: SDR family NAD(P)-dependent oxidoreductase [Acidobacteria bacterium]|nr:MAG: SDR family NAD(P)-dependent oxidoreductase [Acidobacteriota bacterium]